MASTSTAFHSCERNFGHCIVLWQIENFSLAACNSRLVVTTDEFTVSSLIATRWQIGLCLHLKNSSLLKVFLKRLPDEIDDTVRVAWRVTILNGKGEGVFEKNQEFYIARNLKYVVDLMTPLDILKLLPVGEPDEVRFSFQMMVFMNTTMPFWSPRDETVEALINDMTVAAKTGIHSDVTIVVDGVKMNAHRAIICPRSTKLANLIGGRMKRVYQLYHRDAGAVNNLLSYLYTGDLKYILDPPSISIYDCIVNFDIKELRNAYPQEKITMKTIIEAKKFNFRWTIHDFLNTDTPYESKICEADGMDFSLQLRIYPKGLVDGTAIQKKYVYIEVVAVKCNRPRDAYIDFIAKDDKGLIRVARRAYGKIILGKKLEVLFMRIGGYSMTKAVVRDTLDIHLSVHVAKGEINFSVTETCPPVQFNLTNLDTYKMLLHYMGLLLANSAYSDISLVVNKREFKLHKFILASRSAPFSEIIGGIPSSTKSINLNISDLHAFRVFLELLYSGVLTDFNPYVLMYVHDLACWYHVESLKALCELHLESQLKAKNSCHVLMFANEKRLTTLKTAVLHFISAFRDFVIHCKCWKDLEEKNSELYEDVMCFLGRNPFHHVRRPLLPQATLPQIPEDTPEENESPIEDFEDQLEGGSLSP